ncbi:unannotated protein [freshwater metagenome]|uniref:Unannotated protein n=1 Tax=freshwater metagenome TaxID=449393 RepID=A0A6J7EZE4_9ZZZZ
MASLLQGSLSAQGFVVAVAATGAAALEEAESFDPDVALIDITLGDGPTGIDIAYILHRTRPWIALLMLTKHSDPRTAGAAAGELPAGCGYLQKDRVEDTDRLLAAIKAVLADQSSSVRHDQEPNGPMAALTNQQVETLRLMALGYDNEHIASLRSVSRATVERWITQIFRALDIETHGELNPRVEAVRQFIMASSIPLRT